MRRAPAAAWIVEGTYFEACSCLPICPCREVGGRPGGRSTFGVCDFALSWAVTNGASGDIDLTGRAVVMIGSYDDDAPGSPWTVRLFVDDAASKPQYDALADIFLGRAGGTPSRNFTGAIAVVAGVDRAHVSLDHRRRHWSIRVDELVDVSATSAVESEESVACGIPGLDRPGTEVAADVLRVSAAPLSWAWDDRCGFATDFRYVADP